MPTTLTTVDVFLLALIDGGATTVYTMNRAAGLSIGTALPAIRRLEVEGLIAQHKPEARRKQTLSLTSVGRKALKDQRPRVIEAGIRKPPRELNSVLRLASLALGTGDRESCVAILRAAAANRAGTGTVPPRRNRTAKPGRGLGSLYLWMVEIAESFRHDSEAKALRDLVTRL